MDHKSEKLQKCDKLWNDIFIQIKPVFWRFPNAKNIFKSHIMCSKKLDIKTTSHDVTLMNSRCVKLLLFVTVSWGMLFAVELVKFSNVWKMNKYHSSGRVLESADSNTASAKMSGLESSPRLWIALTWRQHIQDLHTFRISIHQVDWNNNLPFHKFNY